MSQNTGTSLSSASDITAQIRHHIVSNLGHDAARAHVDSVYLGLAHTVRDVLIEKWMGTQHRYYNEKVKRVYYISLEFLPGPFLMNNIINLGMEETIRESLQSDFGFSLEEVVDVEWEPGLGNGGLGRLASCYLDSMATLQVPGYGYGIRYTYGIFQQEIVNGAQVEQADPWHRYGNVWEFARSQDLYDICFNGSVRQWTDEEGRLRHEWNPTDRVKAMACDILVPGYRNDYVTNMRLWAAKSARGFNLGYFNSGDYVGALQENIRSENISMVLYPNDESEEGKELRFRQQYFLVSATLQDIMRRHSKNRETYRDLPAETVIHLNETHPAIAIPELMRLLVDVELLDWDYAWEVCVRIFAYTNHTVLPEALEKWPVDLVARLLPRHIQIIYEINRRFLEEVAKRYPGDEQRLGRLSLIEEGPVRYVRMSHLAIVGSHSVNGVAALHTKILMESVFREFCEIYPEKFNNKTNGITPRRFLRQANPGLSGLISGAIGDGWITDLEQLHRLEPLAADPAFQARWNAIRLENKRSLGDHIRACTGVTVNPAALFDIQVKRIHEYKRQLLNVLHLVTLYNRIKDDPAAPSVPRMALFGGKAAPGYYRAKNIIRLINAVAWRVNNDPAIGDRLRVVFLPNYNVKQSEKLIRAADLSEQISTAGMEASGTGNMKFALNGALTIGTLDGANVEIREEVGADNFFLFGLTAAEVTRLRTGGYRPRECYESQPALRRALDQIASGYFSPNEPSLFRDLVASLLDRGDFFMVLADYHDYIRCQDEVASVYTETAEWTRRSILNTARMGAFSSDRAVREYVRDIWRVSPLA